MIHKHHQQVINSLKQYFIQDPEIIALIIQGSVARGTAGPESDVDFTIVVNNSEYTHRDHKNEIHFSCNHLCIPPCTEANGSVKTERLLNELAINGSDVARYAFIKAKVVYSRLSAIQGLLDRITAFPTHESKDKLESFYSQVKMHLSYLKYGHYSQNIYVLGQTATLLALFGGRMILTHNNMFYPGRKWFLKQLEKSEEKPKDFIILMKKLVQNPNLLNANKFFDALFSFKDWPVPQEGWTNRFEKDMKNHLWNAID